MIRSDNPASAPTGDLPEAVLPTGILAIRAGHGANCSSVGSVVDLLFVASASAGALLLAVTAALAERERGSAASGEPSKVPPAPRDGEGEGEPSAEAGDDAGAR